MTLLTIFYGFLDNFLQLYLFCFICSTKFVYAVQKSVARFEVGGGVKAILWTACCCQKIDPITNNWAVLIIGQKHPNIKSDRHGLVN
jgi:hypothetical protein